MSSGKEGEYAYAYGVICSKYSKLFDHRAMENFIEARGISEIVASLEGTEYEKDVQEVIGKDISARSLETVLRKSFNRVYDEIVATIPDKDRILLDAVILEELNVRNMKIILRAIHSGMPEERVGQLIEPFRSADTGFIRGLSESKSIEEFISKLEGGYREALSKEFESYKESNNLLPLESALDRMLIGSWSELMSGDDELQKFVRVRIDLINIRNILRCKAYKLPCKDYVLGEGLYLGKMGLDLMLRGELGDAAEILKNTPYSEVVRESVAEYEKTGSLMRLETGLEKEVIGVVKEQSLFKPLGISSLISFLSMREREIKNLRSVIICKSYDVPPEEIKELMI